MDKTIEERDLSMIALTWLTPYDLLFIPAVLSSYNDALYPTLNQDGMKY